MIAQLIISINALPNQKKYVAFIKGLKNNKKKNRIKMETSFLK
jgi:hypothetical protein